jgi:hypothetical protein
MSYTKREKEIVEPPWLEWADFCIASAKSLDHLLNSGYLTLRQ